MFENSLFSSLALSSIQARTIPNHTAPAATPPSAPHPLHPSPVSFYSQNAIVLNQDNQQMNCYIDVCVIASLIVESGKSQTAERGQVAIDGGRDKGLFCTIGHKQRGYVDFLIQEMVLSGFYSTLCLPGSLECRISRCVDAHCGR